MNKYPFLDLLTESDAMARGANLNDKVTHTVYRTIRSHSSTESIKAGKIFTLDTFVPDILNLTKRDLVNVVNRLISDKLVVELFFLDYDSGTRRMLLHPCFLTLPSEKDLMNATFSAIIRHSLQAIDQLLEGWPAFQADAFRKDLEKDFTSVQIPRASELTATTIDPFVEVHAGNFEINPLPEMLKGTIKDIKEELLRSGRVVDLNDFGLLPIRDEDLIDRFESAATFLESRVIPRYKSKGNLKGELERIYLAEMDYLADEKVAPTIEFRQERADALKKIMRQQPRQEQERGVVFPGSLAVEIVLATAPGAERLYARGWEAECEKMVQEFIEKMTRRDAIWADYIQTYDYAERFRYPEEVWRKIISHMSLLYSSFERSGGAGRTHVFVRRDLQALRALVAGMVDIPLQNTWKILALKFVMEEHESECRELFDDSEFIRSYGKILRRAYIDYIPWYYRIFILLGLTWFQDPAFKIAKSRVGQEQKLLASRNQELIEQAEKNREEERRIHRIRIKDRADSNRIIEKLDLFYHDQLYIPIVADLERAFGDEKINLAEVLSRQRFQLIGSGSEALVLYPVDQEWRSRAARLERSFEKMKEKYELQSGEAATSQLERMEQLRRQIKSAESRKSQATADDDPYKKLAEAIKQDEKRAQKLSRAEPDGDLDV